MTENENFESRLKGLTMPRHVAFIMDGNGRWAKARGLLRAAGHRAGVETVREVVRMSAQYGIEVITLYAFSTENWSRPESEVSALMGLFLSALEREIDELDRNGVKIRFLGDLSRLPAANRASAAAAVARTSGNTGLQLNLAINYGSRAEIVRAARAFAEKAAAGGLDPADLDEAAFSDALYTSGQPDPDLVVRTAGELRLSNFLLWQAAYAEFYATPVFWPDFSREEYAKALLAYAGRKRRFGGLETDNA